MQAADASVAPRSAKGPAVDTQAQAEQGAIPLTE